MVTLTGAGFEEGVKVTVGTAEIAANIWSIARLSFFIRQPMISAAFSPSPSRKAMKRDPPYPICLYCSTGAGEGKPAFFFQDSSPYDGRWVGQPVCRMDGSTGLPTSGSSRILRYLLRQEHRPGKRLVEGCQAVRSLYGRLPCHGKLRSTRGPLHLRRCDGSALGGLGQGE